MLAITGASGFLGSHTLESILDNNLLPVSELIAICRDPSKIKHITDRGVTTRTADFEDRSSITEALKGVDTLLFISVNKIGEEREKLHDNAVQAAKAAGVKKVFYTSHAGSKAGSHFEPANGHLFTEKDLASNGVEYTALRNGFYQWSIPNLLGDISSGSFPVLGEARVSWIDRQDLADATAYIITGKTKFGNNGEKSVNLVNSRDWSWEEVAAAISAATGKKLERTIVSDEQVVVDHLTKTGMPEFFGRMLVGAEKAMAEGDFSITSGDVESILGRKCQDVETFFRKHYSS